MEDGGGMKQGSAWLHIFSVSARVYDICGVRELVICMKERQSSRGGIGYLS